MNREDAIRLVDQFLSQSGRSLSDTEKAILAGAWDGEKYEQIVKKTPYSLAHIRLVGKKLWDALSEIMGQQVTKWNLRHVLEQKLSPVPVLGDCVPNVPRFYGRGKELAALEAAVNHNQCVVLVGPPGIGKTALTTRLLGSLSAHEWNCVAWKSASPVPRLEALVEELVSLLEESANSDSSNGELERKRVGSAEPVTHSDSKDAISLLLDCLQSRRCLIVLDSAELLRGHQEYQPFLRRMVGVPHRSCFLLTSEEPFEYLERWRLGGLAAQTLILRDLDHESAKQILRDKGLTDEQSWQQLIEKYGGNPLILELVANGVKDLFGGHVKEVLTYVTTFFTDLIEELLNRQFKKFEELEKRVMAALAQAKKPLTFADLLRALTKEKISSSDLVQTLDYLDKRSLIQIVKSDDQPTVYQLNSIVRKHTLNMLESEAASFPPVV